MLAKSNISIELDGKSHPIQSFSYSLKQHTDHTGQPASETLGGEIHMTLESTKDNEFLEWMVDSFMRKDGKITIMKSEEEGKLKEFEFKEAFMTDFSESFNESGSGMITLSLSAREISMGNATHENEWLDD
jgi:hypothetical protein